MLYSSIKQLHEAQVFSVSMTSPNSVVDCDIYITAYANSTVKKMHNWGMILETKL